MNPRTKLCIAIAAAGISTATYADDFTLEEIIVTAQKRAESLQDVPVSVSALSSSDLEGLKLRASTEIAAQVPNMQMITPYGDGFAMISMRGISMSDVSLNQSGPIAVYTDEVYKGNPAIQGVQLFDLDRVEVLRGPQGTLYGKNTTGGAVNFITKKATHETEGYLSLGLGDYNRKEVQGAFQSSLIDDVLAARVAGTWGEADGWVENKLAGQDDASAVDEWGVRASLAYTPIEELAIDLRVSSSKSNPTNYTSISDNIASGGVGVGGIGFLGYNRAGLDDYEVESDFSEQRSLETDAVSLTVNYDLSDTLTLTSITSWDDGSFYAPEDTDGSPNNIGHIEYGADTTQWSQDLRLTSDFNGPFNYIAGFYAATEEVETVTNIKLGHDLAALLGSVDGGSDFDAYDCIDTVNNPSGAGCTQVNDYKQTRTSLASYLHTTYDLSDQLTLTFGLRYTEDETELEDFVATLSGVGADTDLATAGTVFDGTVFTTISQATLPVDTFVDREWSGKIGVDYTTEDDTLLYASLSKGYRSGAFNGQAFTDPSEVTRVDPETLNALEIGFKTELMNSLVQLNGAAFYYDYSDQQFLNVDQNLVQTLVNIDKSTIRGFEIEVVARPVEALMLSAGLGWLDAEVEKGVVSGVDLEGNELIAAPDWNFNLSLDYSVPVSDAGGLTLHVDTGYIDDQYFSVFNAPNISQESYWVSNARVSFETAASDYTVAVWIKNIEDKTYKTQSIDFQSAGFDYNQIGTPRTVGVEATVRF